MTFMVGPFFVMLFPNTFVFKARYLSLGAVVTDTAKREFEEWLWEEARVAVKYYHSNNGVFKSNYFTRSCSEDDQTQSFSGVSAQHQNGKAERAIMTVVSMAWEFIVHEAISREGEKSTCVPVCAYTSTSSSEEDEF